LERLSAGDGVAAHGGPGAGGEDEGAVSWS
jgi:hypothetical protein